MNAVVCITDRNYLLPTKVFLSSLVKYLSQETKIFVLSKELAVRDFSDVDYQERLTGIIDFSTASIFRELERHHRRHGGKSHVSVDALAKMQIPFTFGDYSKILYLDVDMLCCSRDINQVFEVDLGDNCIAAVPDPTIPIWRTT